MNGYELYVVLVFASKLPLAFFTNIFILISVYLIFILFVKIRNTNVTPFTAIKKKEQEYRKKLIYLCDWIYEMFGQVFKLMNLTYHYYNFFEIY